MLKAEIGKTAGEMWKHLGKNGKTSLSAIALEMKLKPEIATMAMGWLARENKVNVNREGKSIAITLSDTEAKIYKQTQK
ncbi:MAG: winged helix-turn-helix domain-containing protein [Candidatus Brocadiia bacterium]